MRAFKQVDLKNDRANLRSLLNPEPEKKIILSPVNTDKLISQINLEYIIPTNTMKINKSTEASIFNRLRTQNDSDVFDFSKDNLI